MPRGPGAHLKAMACAYNILWGQVPKICGFSSIEGQNGP